MGQLHPRLKVGVCSRIDKMNKEDKGEMNEIFWQSKKGAILK